jgi:mannose-6-phosphate isomerase-like protein (cupin superfamily)
VEGVEAIYQNDTPIAYVVRADAMTTSTSFFTGDDAPFQAGFVVNPAGGSVVPHIHLPVVRTIVGTSELLLVRRGRCIVDVYGADQTLVASRELMAGDLVISLGGGHGFRMIEDTVLFEVKQGPYGGEDEKERFVPSSDLDRD